MARDPRTFAVLGFRTTHDALAAEAALKAARLDITVIPTPREMGSLCGIAVRLDPASLESAERVLVDARIVPSGRATIEDV